jgi:hypothetical protein
MEEDTNNSNNGSYVIIALITFVVIYAIYILATTNNLSGMRIIYQIRYFYSVEIIIAFILLLGLIAYINVRSN